MLGSGHVNSLEAIADESALGGVRTNEASVWNLWITFMSSAQSTAVLGAGWNKHVLDTANDASMCSSSWVLLKLGDAWRRPRRQDYAWE